MEVVIILGVVVVGWLLVSAKSSTVPAPLAAQIGQNQSVALQQAQSIPLTTAQSSQVQVAQGETVAASVAASAASAIPVVGSLLGIGVSLLGQHTARVAGATAENKGIDNIVPSFDADMKEINAAYVSGQASATAVITALNQVHTNYWQYMSQFQGKPGVAMRACPPGQVGGPMGKGGCTSGQPTCDKGCTAGCCVGCSAINGSLANAAWAVQTGYHGPVAVCAVFGSKFGSHDRAGYQLSW